jgi:hypothetical protein
MTNATTQDHATGRICVDCLMLEANGDWPEWMDADEVAEYRESIDTHPNAGTEMTLGHLHDSPDSQCWHGYRDVLIEVFNINPAARVYTAMAKYRGKESFYREYPQTGHRNVGAPIAPVTMPELCDCNT